MHHNELTFQACSSRERPVRWRTRQRLTMLQICCSFIHYSQLVLAAVIQHHGESWCSGSACISWEPSVLSRDVDANEVDGLCTCDRSRLVSRHSLQKPKFHYTDFPWRPRQTRDVPFSPNSITPTSPKFPRPGSRHSGILAIADIHSTTSASIYNMGVECDRQTDRQPGSIVDESPNSEHRRMRWEAQGTSPKNLEKF